MESEIFREIKEEKLIRKEKCVKSQVFPEEKCIKWHPVAEIYEDLPEVKRFHDDYCKLWNLHTTKNGK